MCAVVGWCKAFGLRNASHANMGFFHTLLPILCYIYSIRSIQESNLVESYTDIQLALVKLLEPPLVALSWHPLCIFHYALWDDNQCTIANAHIHMSH